MKNIFKNSKRGIAAILTLCILLGIGTCVYAASIPEENTAPTEETIQELMPLMASTCNNYSNILRGKPYVPEGCTRIRNDVASVNSSFFISFVTCTYGSFRANEWKKHMETWEDDDGNCYECHYWQGPNGVTYYHN